MPMRGSRTRTTRTPTTGQLLDRAALDNELSKIEKPAGIANPKDFRNEVVKFALRYRAQNDGRNPAWTAYEKIRSVIEKRMFTQVEDLLPVISFESKKDNDTANKHNEFIKRMLARGYTPAPGPPPGRVVHAREQGGVDLGCHPPASREAAREGDPGCETGSWSIHLGSPSPRGACAPLAGNDSGAAMTHFVDRRLNPKANRSATASASCAARAIRFGKRCRNR